MCSNLSQRITFAGIKSLSAVAILTRALESWAHDIGCCSLNKEIGSKLHNGKKVFSAFFARAPTFLWEMAHDRGFFKSSPSMGAPVRQSMKWVGRLSLRNTVLCLRSTCVKPPLIRQIYALTKYNVAGRGAYILTVPLFTVFVRRWIKQQSRGHFFLKKVLM